MKAMFEILVAGIIMLVISVPAELILAPWSLISMFVVSYYVLYEIKVFDIDFIKEFEEEYY
jgi:uncharacterized membrane protein